MSVEGFDAGTMLPPPGGITADLTCAPRRAKVGSVRRTPYFCQASARWLMLAYPSSSFCFWGGSFAMLALTCCRILLVAATFSTDICAAANDEATTAVAKAPATKRANLGDFIKFFSLVLTDFVCELGKGLNNEQVLANY